MRIGSSGLCAHLRENRHHRRGGHYQLCRADGVPVTAECIAVGVCFTRWRKPSTAGGGREEYSPRRAGRGRGALYFDFAGRLLPELHHPQSAARLDFTFIAPADTAGDGAVVCHS